MSAEENEASVSELILFRSEDAKTRIQVRLEGGTVWLTQAQLAHNEAQRANAVRDLLGAPWLMGPLVASAAAAATPETPPPCRP